MSLKNALEWRYATKQFDPTKKVSETDFNELLALMRLTPSSFGLQPWKFIVVETPQLREKIKTIAWNQSQITQASHLIVLTRPSTLTPQDVDRYITSIAKTRNTPKENLSKYQDIILTFLSKMDDPQKKSWMEKQLYIAFGFLMMACAIKHIDACPIEGFAPPELDSLLDLPKRGLNAIALCAIGYRAQTDHHATAPKVRYPLSDIVITL
jgi:nitroreductase